MSRRYWIVLAVVAAAVAAAGGAVAATKLESPRDNGKAIINDAAQRLHVTPGALASALRKAVDDRIDAAVAAGRLTKQQGEAMKAHVDAGRLPFLGGPAFGFRGHRFGLGPPLRAPGMFGPGLHVVTSYLGITPPQLRQALFAGQSLAQIAKAHDKTAGGLVAALVAGAKARLDRGVSSGRLSSTEEQKVLSRLRSAFESLVDRAPPVPLLHPRPSFGFGFGGHRPFGMRPDERWRHSMPWR